jgi:FkbM family methyltransferase
MRRSLEELWLRFIRLYTFNTPLDKGKYRLFTAALKLCKYDHDELHARAKDGRRFVANLSTGMHHQLYFLGQYEKAISDVAARLINTGDICLDVGANFGWYTTLMAILCGHNGSVHAFEPVPKTFRELETNVGLSGLKNITINQNALGDRRDTITIRLPKGEPTGHASIASKSQGNDDVFECEMLTLDNYLADNSIGDVNFVKVDIEGAEMMFLKGASKLFTQNVAPVILMEMALKQSKHFGYAPDDLVKFIRASGDYLFFAVDEQRCELFEIDGFEADNIGANVFCIPRIMSLDPIREKIRG